MSYTSLVQVQQSWEQENWSSLQTLLYPDFGNRNWGEKMADFFTIITDASLYKLNRNIVNLYQSAIAVDEKMVADRVAIRHLTKFRRLVVPHLMNLGLGKEGKRGFSFDHPTFVGMNAGAPLSEDWQKITKWLTVNWAKRLFASFTNQAILASELPAGTPGGRLAEMNRIIHGEHHNDSWGLYRPLQSGYRPAIIHPLTIYALKQLDLSFRELTTGLLFENLVALSAGRTPTLTIADVALIHPHITVATLFTGGAYLMHLAQKYDDPTTPPPTWQPMINTLLEDIARYSEANADTPPFWENQQSTIRQLITHAPDYHLRTVTTTLYQKPRQSLEAVLANLGTTLAEQHIALNAVDFSPSLASQTKIRLPELRAPTPITESGNVQRTATDGHTGHEFLDPTGGTTYQFEAWATEEHQEYSQQLDDIVQFNATLVQAEELAQNTLTAVKEPQTAFNQKIASPLAQHLFPYVSQTAPESDSIAKQTVLQQKIAEMPLLLPIINSDDEPAWKHIFEAKDPWEEDNEWYKVINSETAAVAQDQQLAELTKQWNALCLWDGLRGRLGLNPPARDLPLLDRLWNELDGIINDDGIITGDLTAVRATLAAITHIGIPQDYPPHEKPYLQQLKDSLDAKIEANVPDAATQTAVAARIELGLTMLSTGITPEQAFPQLATPELGIPTLKNWVAQSLGSNNVWESRAGINLLILLARLTMMTGDQDTAKVLADWVVTHERTKTLLQMTAKTVLMHQLPHKSHSSLPLAFIAFDLMRYRREAVRGLTPVAADQTNPYQVLPMWWEDGSIDDLLNQLTKAFTTLNDNIHTLHTTNNFPVRWLALTLWQIELDKYERNRQLTILPPKWAEFANLLKLQQSLRILICKPNLLTMNQVTVEELHTTNWWQLRYWTEQTIPSDQLLEPDFTPVKANHVRHALDNGQLPDALRFAYPTLPHDDNPFIQPVTQGSWSGDTGGTRWLLIIQSRTFDINTTDQTENAIIIVRELALEGQLLRPNSGSYAGETTPFIRQALDEERLPEVLTAVYPQMRTDSHLITMRQSGQWHTDDNEFELGGTHWLVQTSSKTFLIRVTFLDNQASLLVSELTTPLQLINWSHSYHGEAVASMTQLAAALEAAMPPQPPSNPTNHYDQQLHQDIDGYFTDEFPQKSYQDIVEKLSEQIENLEEQEKAYIEALEKQWQTERKQELTDLFKQQLRLDTADYQEQIQAALADVRQAEAELEMAEHTALAASFEQIASEIIYETTQLEIERQDALTEIDNINDNISKIENNIANLEKEIADDYINQEEKTLEIIKLKREQATEKTKIIQESAKVINREIALIERLLGKLDEPTAVTSEADAEQISSATRIRVEITTEASANQPAEQKLLGFANGQLSAMAMRLNYSLKTQLTADLQQVSRDLNRAKAAERKAKRKAKRRRWVKNVCKFIGTAVGAYFGNPALGAAIGDAAGEIINGVMDDRPPEEILIGLADNAFTIASAAGYDLEAELNELGAKGGKAINSFFDDMDTHFAPLLDSLPTVFNEKMLSDAFDVLDLSEIEGLPVLIKSSYTTLQKDVDSLTGELGTLGSALKKAAIQNQDAETGDLILFDNPKQLFDHLTNNLADFSNTQAQLKQLESLANTVGVKIDNLSQLDQEQLEKIANNVAERTSKVLITKLSQEAASFRQSAIQTWIRSQQEAEKHWDDVQEEGKELLTKLFPDPNIRAEVIANVQNSLLDPATLRGEMQLIMKPWQEKLDERLQKILSIDKNQAKPKTAVQALSQQKKYLEKVLTEFVGAEEAGISPADTSQNNTAPFLKWLQGEGDDNPRSDILRDLQNLKDSKVTKASELTIGELEEQITDIQIETVVDKLKIADKLLEKAQKNSEITDLKINQSAWQLKIRDIAKLKAEKMAEAQVNSAQAAKERAQAAQAAVRAAQANIESHQARANGVTKRGIEASRIRSLLSQPLLQPDRQHYTQSATIASIRHSQHLDIALIHYREMLRYLNSIGANIENNDFRLLRPDLPTEEPIQESWSSALSKWVEAIKSADIPLPNEHVNIKLELTAPQIAALTSPTGLRLAIGPHVEENKLLFTTTSNQTLPNPTAVNTLTRWRFTITGDHVQAITENLNEEKWSDALKDYFEENGVFIIDEPTITTDTSSQPQQWHIHDTHSERTFLIKRIYDENGNAKELKVYQEIFTTPVNTFTGWHFTITEGVQTITNDLNNKLWSDALKDYFEENGVFITDEPTITTDTSSQQWHIQDTHLGRTFLIEFEADNKLNVYQNTLWYKQFALHHIPLSRNITITQINTTQWHLTDMQTRDVLVQAHDENGQSPRFTGPWYIESEPTSYMILAKGPHQFEVRRRYQEDRYDPALGGRSMRADQIVKQITSQAHVSTGRVVAIFIRAKKEDGENITGGNYDVKVDHMGDVWRSPTEVRHWHHRQLIGARGIILAHNEQPSEKVKGIENELDSQGSRNPFINQGPPLVGTTLIRLCSTGGTAPIFAKTYPTVELIIRYKSYS